MRQITFRKTIVDPAERRHRLNRLLAIVLENEKAVDSGGAGRQPESTVKRTTDQTDPKK